MLRQQQHHRQLLAFVLLLIACCYNNFCSVVRADIATRVVAIPLNGETCSSADWSIVAAQQQSRRQRLRHRQLSESSNNPFYCEDFCLATPPGMCYIVHSLCTDFRRRRQLTDSTVTTTTTKHSVDKSLFDSIETIHEQVPTTTTYGRAHRNLAINQAECNAEKLAVNVALDNAIPLVSDDCKDVLLGHRDLTCFETNDICENLSFHIWDTNTQTVVVSNAQDGVVVPTADFSMEVATESCMDKVEFLLSGPNGYVYARVEELSLYTLFGDNGTNVASPPADMPTTGTFTLTIQPKRNSKFPIQTITFTI